MRTLWIFFAIMIIAVSAACTNSTAPSSTTLAGSWTGSIQYTVSGTTGQQTISMSLQQSGDTVSGTYATTSQGFLAAGNMAIQGTVSGTFIGTMNFAPTSNPNGCSGIISLSGTGSGSNTVTWTSSGITSTCGALTPSTVTVTATHQSS
jgi:hypothetical protein